MTERSWRTDVIQPKTPVCRPALPSADELLPYLRRMDVTRWYSNGGPLVGLFEERLAEHVQADDPRSVVTTSSATAGLTAALLASSAPHRSLCMVPAWTFAATAHAVVAAGLVPWLVDVDPLTGALLPDMAESLLAQAPASVGAIVPVAPFGAPFPVDAWECFQSERGVAVVVDAAAGFDTVRASTLSTVVSLHATKVLGVGEGGFVVHTDRAVAARTRAATNFGFSGSRQAQGVAINAKMSEYAAAVGNAGLDGWWARREGLRAIASWYAGAAPSAGLALAPGFGDEWISNTVVIRVHRDAMEGVEDALATAGAGSRRWWGEGLGGHPAFNAFPRTSLMHTASLAASTLGLPFWPGLARDAVHRTCEVIRDASLVSRA